MSLLFFRLFVCPYVRHCAVPLKRWNRSLPGSRTSVIWCRNYGVRKRLSAKSPASVYRIRSRAGENERKFLEIRCWRVKNYSWEKSILLNDGGKVRQTNKQTNKKTELFNSIQSNKISQTSRCQLPCIKRETL